jgi:hypothetical protein
MRVLKCLAVFVLAAGVATATPLDEIESLLHYIGGLNGASFIRNGDAHTTKEAEAHLRLKWSKQKSQITTAEDHPVQRWSRRRSSSGFVEAA